jgi:shikimate kinase
METAERSIVLIGMMGAGKSSVGRALARRLVLPRFDTDELLASEHGMPVAQVFTKFGEERFRDAETAILRDIDPARRAVVVTGGGIVLRPENPPLLRRLGAVVWLKAAEERLFERVSRRNSRPLLQTADPRQTLRALLAQREPLYAAAADLVIDTSSELQDQVTTKIIESLSANGS